MTFEVCPICGLTKKQCDFFRRVSSGRFATNKAESSRIRVKMFMLYHADICPNCKLPAHVCKERKIARVVKWMHKNYGYSFEVGEYLDAESCRAPRLPEGNAVLPDWWPKKAAKG